MSDVYPEWIQEQLDKMHLRSNSDECEGRDAIRRAVSEARITHHLGCRLERLEVHLQRIEAKLDRLLDFCECELKDE